MRVDQRTYTSEDGTSIHRRTWWPSGEPKASVCLVHGLGEHSGRYDYVAERLTTAGYAVFALDMRGHGHSGGTRGDVRVAQTVADISALVADAAEEVPDAPVVLYGHSLGGLMSMTAALDPELDIVAVVASAPALDTTLREQKAKFLVANLLGGIVPGVAIPSGLDATALSRNPEVVEAYLADPLTHDKASLGLAKESVAAMDALAQIDEFPQPLLIIHGTADTLTVPAASAEFTHRVHGDITLHEYEGMLHEPHNEPERDDVLDEIVAWIDDRVAGA